MSQSTKCTEASVDCEQCFRCVVDSSTINEQYHHELAEQCFQTFQTSRKRVPLEGIVDLFSQPFEGIVFLLPQISDIQTSKSPKSQQALSSVRAVSLFSTYYIRSVTLNLAGRLPLRALTRIPVILQISFSRVFLSPSCMPSSEKKSTVDGAISS